MKCYSTTEVLDILVLYSFFFAVKFQVSVKGMIVSYLQQR